MITRCGPGGAVTSPGPRDNVAVGLGDLLVYGLFTVAALKAYGLRAARFALTLVVIFGALVPALVPLLINYIDPSTNDILVPAQAWFGPAAYLGYRWLRRKNGPERTMKEFLASSDFLGRRPGAVPAGEVPAVVPVPTVAPAPAVREPVLAGAAGSAGSVSAAGSAGSVGSVSSAGSVSAVGSAGAAAPAVEAGETVAAGQPVLDNATP